MSNLFTRRLRRLLRRSVYNRCVQPIEEFASMGQTEVTENGPLTFIDHGSNVLAVGHLDFIDSPKWPNEPRYDHEWIQTSRLDDRLGVAIILDILPQLGVECDVLLTDSEESGNSTAQYFDPPKEYNWIFEFDRAGTDVVMYEYETEEAVEYLTANGWEVGFGSFTDICYLNHLGVQGFNFGCGYHEQHRKTCYAFYQDIRHNIERFVPIYHDLKDTRLDWEEPPEPKWGKWYRPSPAKVWDDDIYVGEMPLGYSHAASGLLVPNEEKEEEPPVYDDWWEKRGFDVPYGYPDRWECPDCFGQTYTEFCTYCGHDPLYVTGRNS